MYIVQTYMYMYIQIYTHFDSTSTYMFVTYFLFTYKYDAVQLMFDLQMATYMKCTDFIELCTYTDVSFWLHLFVLPCCLAYRKGLAAARCHAYSSSSTLVY